MKTWKDFYNINPRLYSLCESVLQEVSEEFKEIEQTARFNGVKVLNAFRENRVSAAHLVGTGGYGYDDIGRDNLDRVAATVFGCEDALVRHNFMSGTHTISVALSALLRSGDTILSVTGTPYDTLHSVIGIGSEVKRGSLVDLGVKYKEVALKEDGMPDLEAIKASCRQDIKIAYIQRSRGYSLRPSYTSEVTKEIITAIREANSSALIVVDNCYCEFVDVCEPTEYGADLIIGSLIKNAGGGIARTGGYVAGKKELVSLCADRLCFVGAGKEIGCSLDMNRELYLGLFKAPQTVGEALKTAVFTSRFFSRLGFGVTPQNGEKRADIVQCLKLKNSGNLCLFCKGIQEGAPIDSFVSPQPSEMPGYESKVIMAAGTFTLGASIELSADAPLREPFAVWLQGAHSFDTALIGVLLAAENLLNSGAFSL